jgi:electron transfer flavoprotein beta subunit
MQIIVLMKQTFDTEEKVVIEGGAIREDGVNFIINPYDEYAVEEAIKIKEQTGGEVTIVTVGSSRSESAIRTALAMGADQAILIEQEADADEYTIAQLIVAALKDKPFDLILGGNMAVDSGAGQVAIRVAEALGIAHVGSITKLTLSGRTATVERDAEGDVETIEVALPFLATAQQGLNEPRYPSLPGIMKAKKKPLEVTSAANLGLDADAIRARTVVLNQYLPAKKTAGKVLSGNLAEQAQTLAQLLRQEANVI